MHQVWKQRVSKEAWLPKRMLPTKNVSAGGDFSEYYCQSKQYWYKTKILQALEGALGDEIFTRPEDRRLRWGESRVVPRRLFLITELFDEVSLTSTKERIIRSKYVYIVLGAYSSRVRCSFHYSFEKNNLATSPLTFPLWGTGLMSPVTHPLCWQQSVVPVSQGIHPQQVNNLPALC